MKKLAIVIVVVFTASLFVSCKSNHRCAAYSKADVQKTQKPS